MNKLIPKIGAAIVTITVFFFAVFLIVDFPFGYYLVCMFLPIGYIIMAAGFHHESSEGQRVSANIGMVFSAIYAVLIFLVYFAQTTTVRLEKLNEQAAKLLDYVQGGLLFNYDLLGYGMMALSTFFIGLSIPSSCRLSNFVDLIGKEVLLTSNSSPNTRTEYAVYALRIRGQFILLNMSHANRLIENNIRSRRFSYLGKRTTVRKEYCIEGYKSDLYIENSQTAVEIKSILSFDKKATFPTVYSQRAIDQLIKLTHLLDMEYKVCYILVSLNPSVKEVNINKEIVEYYKLFTEW